MRKKIICSVCYLGVCIFLFAQPSRDDIGAQLNYFENELKREKKEFEKPITIPKIEVKREEKSSLPSVTFFLRDVKITGVTAFKQEEIYALCKDYLNKQVNLSDLEELINKITQKYYKAGYVTTEAYIPPQEIKDGIVEIKIDEGKVGDIHIEGNRYFSTKFIKKQLRVKKDEILNVNVLKKSLIELNQNPDLNVQLVLSAGKEPSTSDIRLKVTDRFFWHVGAGVDNRGLRLTGKIRNKFLLRCSNFSGNGDIIFLHTIKTSRSFGQALSYELPIPEYQTKFGIDFSYFTMTAGKEYKHLKIQGDSYLASPYIRRRLYLSEISQLNFVTGLKIKSIDKEVSGQTKTNEELRIPYFSFEFNQVEPSGSIYFEPVFSFGTEDFLGASSRLHPSASRANTGGFFFKYEQNFRKVKKLPLQSYAVLNSQFQFSTNTLPTSEQFALGGLYSVRGYPEGDYLADIGGNVNLEWHFPIYLIPKDWKLKKHTLTLREEIQPIMFIDWGYGRLKDTDIQEIRRKELLGVGGGLRFRGVIPNTFIQLIWAKHLGDEPISGNGPSTFYFSFQADF